VESTSDFTKLSICLSTCTQLLPDYLLVVDKGVKKVVVKTDRARCSRATKRFLSVSKPSTVPDATNVLPTQHVFFKHVRFEGEPRSWLQCLGA
jgi:hypothetical protein